jgi:hypothetical protein
MSNSRYMSSKFAVDIYSPGTGPNTFVREACTDALYKKSSRSDSRRGNTNTSLKMNVSFKIGEPKELGIKIPAFQYLGIPCEKKTQ